MKVCDIVQEPVIKTIPKKKKCKKPKWLSEEALQIALKRRDAKSNREKESYLNAEFKRIARRDKKAFLSDQCKETEENNRTGKTEISRKLKIPREHTGHSKYSLITTQEITLYMDITSWSIPKSG